MHENHVCHRDIKPENFLFASPAPIDSEDNLLKASNLEVSSLSSSPIHFIGGHPKVIDFGLSCRFVDGQRLTTKAGSGHHNNVKVHATRLVDLRLALLATLRRSACKATMTNPAICGALVCTTQHPACNLPCFMS
eukprot:5097782-Amphidinium_carterae.1